MANTMPDLLMIKFPLSTGFMNVTPEMCHGRNRNLKIGGCI